MANEKARRLFYRRLYEIRQAASHPAQLLKHVRCVDSTTGERFRFALEDTEDGWYWQRSLLDEWVGCLKHIALKARQIGITWLGGGFALWTILYTPGSQVLIVSINEAEAIKVVNRIWDMLQSLPKHLWNGAVVIKPVKARPTSEIHVQFPDGRVSVLRGLTSTPSAGHGSTAALVLLDEFSRQPYAAETWKAVLPTTQGGGRVVVISTGNGISNERGGGNYYHHLWVNADEYGLERRFLPWDLHPGRDEEWYRQHAEALPPAERGEQYPRDETEAFILTGRPFFDVETLSWYARNGVRKPIGRFDFESTPDGASARRVPSADGPIRMYESPEDGVEYAIGADTSTGHGYDFSCAYVVNLATMSLAAEFHGKIDADLYATQLHFLGKWYKTAVLAVENAFGHGEAVSIQLRDGKAGRPPYPRLHRHMMSNRPDQPRARAFGYPITIHTRPLIINQLEKALRDRLLPYVTGRLLAELQTFVHANTNPTPRAQDGCNDDAVMACAITLEMYRLHGHHELQKPRRSRRKATQTHSFLVS